MDPQLNLPPLGPTAPVAEILLAETAIRIELPPSLHKLAVDRYEAIRKHIERVGSPLNGRVRIFYPQGSMAIRATIISRRRADGYDIDIVAELILPTTTAPAAVLDLLFAAINGSPGSQYHGMVERQTRCVTVNYADGMHIDITPTLLLNEMDPRQSCLFHAKKEEPTSEHRRLRMNSFGFCEWVNANSPIDVNFEEAYGRRAMAFDARRTRADADVVAVPAHSTVEGGKSVKIVAQQLLKRNRNLRYEKRDGRLPPSAMIAKFGAKTTVTGASIAWALDAISAKILGALEQAERDRVLIDVRNPRCEDERFTDRWPENRRAQRVYIEDLKLFRQQLATLQSQDLSLADKRKILADMFGIGPAQSVIDDLNAKIGVAVQTGQRVIAPTGRVIAAATAPATVGISRAAAQPRGHAFFGSRWRRE